MLQYLSFETIEKMLIEMKTLKLHKMQNEFLMLTQFHGENIDRRIKEMQIEQEIKDTMLS